MTATYTVPGTVPTEEAVEGVGVVVDDFAAVELACPPHPASRRMTQSNDSAAFIHGGNIGIGGRNNPDLGDAGTHTVSATGPFLEPGGAFVKQVQAVLGHASPVITLQTYSHLWPGDEDRTRDVMDAVLSPVIEKRKQA